MNSCILKEDIKTGVLKCIIHFNTPASILLLNSHVL